MYTFCTSYLTISCTPHTPSTRLIHTPHTRHTSYNTCIQKSISTNASSHTPNIYLSYTIYTSQYYYATYRSYTFHTWCTISSTQYDTFFTPLHIILKSPHTPDNTMYAISRPHLPHHIHLMHTPAADIQCMPSVQTPSTPHTSLHTIICRMALYTLCIHHVHVH